MDAGRDDELAFEALMHEFEFVSSLIKMYRETELDLVRMAITLYGAAIGIVGATLELEKGDEIGVMLGALLPWPILLLVLGYISAEIRIKRASRFIERTQSVEVNRLLNRIPATHVLTFERGPGKHLTPNEKRLASSLFYVVMLGAPAVVVAGWSVLAGGGPVGLLALSAIAGALCLVAAMVATMRISAVHETRNAEGVVAPERAGAA